MILSRNTSYQPRSSSLMKVKDRVFPAQICGPSGKRACHNSQACRLSEWEKRGIITYSADQGNEVSNMYVISLGTNRGGRLKLKQTFHFTEPYSEIRPEN